MSTVAEHVPFLHLVKLCQKISDKKGKGQKLQPLVEFIEYWRKFHNKLHIKDPNTTDSFYSAIRLLLPQCERQRASYGIKEFTLAKLLIDIFCLDKKGVDAQKLINYRSPKSANAEAGDFASVAYFVLKNRSPEIGSLKIYDVNYYLDSIATNNASKNKDDLKQDLLHLLRNTCALEQKWLIRMILKDMKLGISENTVLKAYHADAKDLYNVTNSLEKVCCSLKDPSVRLHEIEISLFSPFRPMLAEIASIDKVEDLMSNKSFLIETKFDGERLQLHKDGNSYMYFSRGGHDCTDTYGSSPLQGNFTFHISKSFKPGVSKCILDGEIVIYSTKMNCIVSKGENADVQALQPDGDYGPCFCVYDILMFNDKVLTNLPLTERVTYIKDTFTPIENRIRYTEQKVAATRNEVMEELNYAIDNRLEGIMVKNPYSIYKPNMRKNSGWLKIKPDYIDNLMDELDLLIIGGYFGEGHRSNIISHFLLAVASPEKNADGEPKCFYSFCKVGSGYSMKELLELTAKIGQHWETYNPKKPPSSLVIGGSKKEQPDLFIKPSKSQILQVKAAEIVRSKGFATNCTLRFPRVEKIRYDKPWYQCMTTTELEDLRNVAQGRLATRNVVSEEEPSPKKQRFQKENTISVAPHFRPTDTSNVKQISELLKNKEMCVISASLQKKQQMEKQITEHGGKFVQNPGSKTFCVVTDKVTAKVKNIISTNMYDVVRSEWLDRCIEKNQILSWTPDDMFHSTQQTLEKLREDFDAYGDSFTEDATEESLRKTFDDMKLEMKNHLITMRKIAALEDMFSFSEIAHYRLFRHCRIHVVKKCNAAENSTDKMELIYWQLKLQGANVCEAIDDDTTHVVIHSSDTSSVKELNSISAEQKQGRFHLVTEKWVEDTARSRRRLDEKLYMPVSDVN